MRSLDVIRQKRRFEMFDANSKKSVLEVNSFFGKYNMHYEEKIKKLFTYYDTPNKDLEKSNILLYKTTIGTFTELNMATEKVNVSSNYNMRTNYKHFTKQIKPGDKILKHKEFLIDSFKNMFLSGVNFDPEFLLNKLQIAYEIRTTSREYRSMNVTGLKVTYSFDEDTYTNMYNKVTLPANILTIYQHSSTKTDEDFDDLVSKLTRYCKEITPTDETKIMIARRLTVKKAEADEKARQQKLQKLLEQKNNKKKY